MMLKRKIKIILVGLFSVLFVGLVYSLFSSKPEIISDESLRVEEPVIPGIESQVERAASAGMRSISAANIEIESSLESKLIDQPVASYREEIVSQVPETLQADPLNPQLTLNSESEQINAESEMAMSTVNEPIDTDDVSEQSEDPADALSDGSSDFLDLNLSELESTQPEIMLPEGDQLIVDDINQSLSQYKSVASEGDKKMDASKDKKEVITKNTKDSEAMVIQDLPENIDDTASIMIATKPSVFTMPDVDESLMTGESEISKQYRQTMSKLISINAKLRNADEENAELKTQFEIAVSQNRQLAQIIRDINSQIEAHTLTN